MTLTELEQENFDDLFEMANIHSSVHGIPDVVIWVGRANQRHGLRVKVSNKKNRFDPDDHFVIQMPSLDYDHRQVARWITPTIMNQILDWIKTYQAELHDYENGLVDDTFEFLNRLKSASGRNP